MSYDLLPKYEKIIKIFKLISKLVGLDQALDVSDVKLKFHVSHIIDYFFVVYYILSVIYAICTKYDNKMNVLRPVTLCPITIQV